MMEQLDLLRREIDAVMKERDEFLNALQWCSASSDFQAGGYARKGWLKLCAPLIAKKPYFPEEKSEEVDEEDNE